RRRYADTGTLEHVIPVAELAGARLAVPGASLRHLRLQLEEIPAERPLQPGKRGLRPVGRAPERCLPLAGRARIRVAARPALEQPAERERGHLAGAELGDQPARGLLASRALGKDVGPVAGGRDGAHTSTTIGRIIGRRPVRSYTSCPMPSWRCSWRSLISTMSSARQPSRISSASTRISSISGPWPSVKPRAISSGEALRDPFELVSVATTISTPSSDSRRRSRSATSLRSPTA